MDGELINCLNLKKKSDSQTLIKNNVRNIVVLKYTLSQFIL